jgi:hypothetical protein
MSDFGDILLPPDETGELGGQIVELENVGPGCRLSHEC